MNVKYAIGQTVYYGQANRKPIMEICPVCNGDLWVTLILGNGTQVQIGCEYCARQSRDLPEGHVIGRYEWQPSVSDLYISGIEIGGKATKYHVGSDNCHRTFEENMLSATYEEAFAMAEKCVEEAVQRQEGEIGDKVKQSKSYAWNAGYALKKLGDIKWEQEYWEKRVKIYESRVRK